MKGYRMILLMVLIAGLLCINCLGAAAEEDLTTGLVYTLSGAEAIITGFNPPAGFDGDLTIPAALGSASVIAIGNSAFKSCTTLENVNLPDGVTSIGESAFESCWSLQSINLPNSVTNLGSSAFRNCYALESIVLSNNLSAISYQTFASCYELTNVTIPSSITVIGDQAFAWCQSLTSITIPSSVTNIRYNAFGGCIGLTSITIPGTVTTLGDNVFENCVGLTSVTLDNGVTSISNYAFRFCNSLTDVTIAGSIGTIGKDAFSSCTGLTSLTIPEGVQLIDASFKNCTNLSSITIPASVTRIETDAFSGCSDDITIYGTADSYAQQFASNNDINFSIIGASDPPTWPEGSALTASDTTESGTILSWTAAQDDNSVVGYRIYRNGGLIQTVAGELLRFDVSGLAPSTTYIFQVQAGDEDNNWSVNGPTVNVTTGGLNSYLTVYVNCDATHGSVAGGGSYAKDAPVTVTATAASGYRFVNWTESGTVVSITAVYSFAMGEENRNLVANFQRTTPGNGGSSGGAGGGDNDSQPVSQTEEVTPPKPEKPAETKTINPLEEPHDLAGHWANDCTMALLQHGTINGYPDNTVRPDAEISRAEAAVLLVSALGLQEFHPSSIENPYHDQLPDWARQAILIVTEKRLMMGYPDGTFRPDQKITRAEMCVALMQAFPHTTPAQFQLQFTDAAAIPHWSQPFVTAAVADGFVSGYTDNTFRPDGKIKRGETFSIICRLKGYHLEHGH